MAKKLTGINYIPRGDGTYVDFNELTEKEKTEVSDKITTRLMETLGYKKVAQEEKKLRAT